MPKVIIQKPTPEEKSPTVLKDLAAVMERIIAKEFGVNVKVELFRETDVTPKEIIGA